MKARWAGLALGAALFAGCRQQPMAVMENSGQQIYLARCAVCHGQNPPMYPPLTGSQWVDGPPGPLAAIILDGMQVRAGNYDIVMPAWGATMQDTEIAAVMTWLRKADGKPPVTAVEVNHVRVETAARNSFWTVEDLRNLPNP